MRNKEKRNMHGHTDRKDFSADDDTYVNIEELENGAKLFRSVGTKKATNKKNRVILAALILLTILFLILAAMSGLLLRYYLTAREAISQLKNQENNCTPCPDGWKRVGSSCYYVSEEEITWEEARDECYKNNSVLVIIKDKTELDTLNKLIKNDTRYWIGLTRYPEASIIWKWLDGTQLTFKCCGDKSWLTEVFMMESDPNGEEKRK
ncbi:natural killer cells antigen CD94-like isoform X2 [Dendropsophus ebraccatus]|uniref:natural killer cells antigen CD94-like isoform X2 n=1 Tax=Dendropsophus ebraccatus TaxID=150705 RepID=UPI003831BDF7